MIYENVQQLCRERNISIVELEKLCGIGNGTIGKWNGKISSPRVDKLQAIASYFGVSVDELLREKKEAECSTQ